VTNLTCHTLFRLRVQNTTLTTALTNTSLLALVTVLVARKALVILGVLLFLTTYTLLLPIEYVVYRTPGALAHLIARFAGWVAVDAFF